MINRPGIQGGMNLVYLKEKFQFFESFWKGEGPFPLLFAKPHLAKEKNYILYDLEEQHRDPVKLVEEAVKAAEPALLGIDDGIPAFRTDLGTTLFPSSLGLRVAVQKEVHPWLLDHLSLDQYIALRDVSSGIREGVGEIGHAVEAYRLFLHRKATGSIPQKILPYVPDNQGIFDLSHIIVGTEIFTALIDTPEKVHQAQSQSLKLYLSGTRLFKALLSEPETSMFHAHGMISGVWFPHTGARISEDSCSLISDAMIEEFCLPYIREALKPFGRGFLHFCGRHEGFLSTVCKEPLISTLNLGNPELYDLEEVFRLCGATDTVYFGHLDPEPDESMETFLERIAGIALRHKARLILVAPPVEGVDRKRSLVSLWHRLTKPV